MSELPAGSLGNRGAIYVTSGLRFAIEAAESVRTLKQQMPTLPAVLYTDQKADPSWQFDRVLPLAKVTGRHLDKIEPLLEFPFERALFLDSDTVICRPCEDLFDLLDYCDFAAAAEPARHPDAYKLPGIPAAFAEINTGVMAYRATESVRQLFTRWLELAIAGQAKTPPDAHDQPAFRQALAESPVRFYTLPPEYNFRADFPAFMPAWAELKILHARKGDLAHMRATIDASQKIRVFLPSEERCKPDHFAILTPKLNRLVRGQFSLLQKAANWRRKRNATR